MRKHLLVGALLSLLFCGVCSVAQDAPKNEIFGGYSYLHLDTGSTGIPNSVPAGFDADVTHYLIGPFGVTADFEYHHKSFSPPLPRAASFYGLNAGPRFKARVGKLEPFGHLLVGFTHGSLAPNPGVGGSDNTFSMKLGAGLDYAATRRIALRLAEANLYYTEFKVTGRLNLNNNGSQNNFTLSTGIVFRP